MLAFLYGDICIFAYIPISLALYRNKYQIIYAYTYICMYVFIYAYVIYIIYIYIYILYIYIYKTC